jgi:hypothetical protein
MSHQHAIHGGYYKALNSHPGEEMQHTASGEHEEHDDPGHLRHCFDYIRQSLMCAADTNVEPMNKELKGVTGWGFTRQCRSYDAVFKWTGQNKPVETT